MILSYQTGVSALYLLLHILRFFSFVTQRGCARLIFDVVDEQLTGELHDRDRRDAERQVLIDRRAGICVEQSDSAVGW